MGGVSIKKSYNLKMNIIDIGLLIFILYIIISIAYPYISGSYSHRKEGSKITRLNANARVVQLAVSDWLNDCKEAGYDIADLTFITMPIEAEKMLSADPFSTEMILSDFTFADYLGGNYTGYAVVYIENGGVVQVWWAENDTTDMVGGYPYYAYKSTKDNNRLYENIGKVTIESLEPFINEDT